MRRTVRQSLRPWAAKASCKGPGQGSPYRRRLWQKRSLKKRPGFLLMELLLVMALFSAVLTVTITMLRPAGFQAHVQDVAFVNRFKGALLRHRMQSVREPTQGCVVDLPGDGRAIFKKQGKPQTVFDDPVYRIYHRKGTPSQIVTRWNFKSQMGHTGSTAYTLVIYKGDRLMTELIYQLGTSTFREVYHEKP